MKEMHERLTWARETAGYESASAAAEAMDMVDRTYIGHENGHRGFKSDTAAKYARKFKVSLEWLLTGRGEPRKGNPRQEAQAVGYVGAGAEVYPIDDHAMGAGLELIEIPPGVPPDAVLVIVRGDSMYPRYFDNELLFYVRRDNDPAEFVNRECVVQLADGRVLVKLLRQGSKKGLFSLHSWNAEPIDDKVVEWAAPVLARVNRAAGR